MHYDMTHLSTVWLPILLDAAIKGMIVLGLAAVASVSMRRASASARHLVWFLVLVSLPVLPILSATLPDWRVLPGWVMLPGEVDRPVEAAAADPESPVLVEPSGSIDPVSVVANPAVSAVVPLEANASESERPVAPAEPIANVVAIEKPWPRAADESVGVNASVPWQPWTLFIWLIGSLVAGLPILAGTASLWWLQRKSKRVTDGPILTRLMQLARQMGVRCPVVLLQSARRSMPMQWGLLRPKLLLPATADDWSAERRQVVLLHELAHIGRHDCLTQLAARIVCALYWFNPMVWIALRQLRLERERACDDLILDTGCKPSNYAEHLLAVASGFHTSRLAGFCAIAMARPSALEGRLLAILDPRQNRRRLSRTIVLFAMATLLCVVIPMAMMRAAEDPVVAEQADVEEPSEGADADDTDKPPLLATLVDPDDVDPDHVEVEFGGRVVDDETGEPVERFGLQWGLPFTAGSTEIGWGGITESRRAHKGGKFHEKLGSGRGRIFALRILADGYLPQPVTPEPVTTPAKNTDLVVRLKRGFEVRGRIVDHTGKPVSKAIACLGGNQMVKIVNGKLEHFAGSKMWTNEDGRFVLRGVDKDKKNSVIVSVKSLHIWRADIPELGKDVEIVLPEPATLKIRYKIPGGPDKAKFRLHMKTWEIEQWKGVVESVQEIEIRNGGEIVLNNLAPGTYDLARVKTVHVGDYGQGAFCGRRDVTLKSGKSVEAGYVRSGGHPITGQVVGLGGTGPNGIDLTGKGVAGAFLFVKEAGATGNFRDRTEWKMDTFDAQAVGVDGRFKTEHVAPGTYTVIVHAYKPEDRSRTWHSGIRLPDLIGSAKVTVEADRPPEPVQIEMKPRPTPADTLAERAVAAAKAVEEAEAKAEAAARMEKAAAAVKAAEEEKARAEAATREAAARRSRYEFGPTVERTVVGEVPGGSSLIDFDRDVVFRIPTELVDAKDAKKFLAWAKQHGIDASITISRGEDFVFVGFTDLAGTRTDSERWDSMTPAELRADRELQSAEPGFGNISKRPKDLPATYRLKTRDGGLGMLQITEMTEDPAAVKIRYKMVPRSDKNPIAWGEPVKGLQLGLTFDPQNRAYRVGEVIHFEVLARNVGPKSLELADYVGVNPPRDGAALIGWAPMIHDSQGKKLLLNSPPMSRPVLPRQRSLPPGHTMVVGTVSFKSDTKVNDRDSTPRVELTPGNYQVSQTYRFDENPKPTWSGELTSGQLSLKIINRERRFHGLDLSDAPSTIGPEKLPELFEARPPGSKSYHIRDDIETIYNGLDGTVYVTADKKRFYVQHDLMGASTLHYYGPFDGDPWTKIALATGQVIDSQGKPVAGATVEFPFPRQNGHHVNNVRSDRHGRFMLPPIEPKSNIRAAASAPGYATRHAVNIFRQADGSYYPDSGKVVLYRAATLLGRVIDPDGKPLSAAPLSLSTEVEYVQPDAHLRCFSPNHLRAITDKQGRFRLEGVPPGTHMLFYPWEGPIQGRVVSERSDEFAKPDQSLPLPGISGVAIVEVSEGQEVKNVTIDLSQSTCAVKGRVVDADGRPLRGVQIAPTWKAPTAKWLTFSPPKRAYGRIVTDKDGRYEIRNLPPGRWELIAWHDLSKKRTDPEAVELSQGKTTRCDLQFPVTIAREAADE